MVPNLADCPFASRLVCKQQNKKIPKSIPITYEIKASLVCSFATFDVTKTGDM